jgi:UDPglucose 6-dehydrogenase
MRISVVGAGRRGATQAACLAGWGHEVVTVASNAERLGIFTGTLTGDDDALYQRALEEMLTEQMARGRLRFTCDIADVAGRELHFLCVGATKRADGSTDLTAIQDAVDAIAPYAGAGLVVGTAIVPPGTLASLLERPSVRRYGVRIAWNPGLFAGGGPVDGLLRPDRLAFGLGEHGDEGELSGAGSG